MQRVSKLQTHIPQTLLRINYRRSHGTPEKSWTHSQQLCVLCPFETFSTPFPSQGFIELHWTDTQKLNTSCSSTPHQLILDSQILQA